jgi:TonB family protein
MKIKLNGNLRQGFQITYYFCSILLIASFFFGCASSQKQTAKISSDFKPDGSGYSYAEIVKDVYTRAWEPSTNSVMSDIITRVKVTIGKNGEVLSATIIKFSGNKQMDKSVQKMLNSIRFIQPFENDSTNVARTFIVNFDLKTEKSSENTSMSVYVSNDISSQKKTIIPFEQYDTTFRNSITKSWYALLDKQKFIQPKTSKVVLQFHLTYNGQITDMKILENNAGDALALICQKAVLASVPYKRWPNDMIRMVGANYREMTFTFNYW